MIKPKDHLCTIELYFRNMRWLTHSGFKWECGIFEIVTWIKPSEFVQDVGGPIRWALFFNGNRINIYLSLAEAMEKAYQMVKAADIDIFKPDQQFIKTIHEKRGIILEKCEK